MRLVFFFFIRRLNSDVYKRQDDERLKQGKHFGKDYFDDLLERIREIRTSERRYYQKITDIYAECSACLLYTSEDPYLYNTYLLMSYEFLP